MMLFLEGLEKINREIETEKAKTKAEKDRTEKANVWLEGYKAFAACTVTDSYGEEVDADPVYHADRCLEAYESRFMKKEV